MRQMRQTFLIIATCVVAAAAHADEGMWTFDNFPAAAVRGASGTSIGQGWLDHVRRSVVRIEGGCTGSFVSPEGLILTNHHCVEECLQQISTAERNATANGFFAVSRKDEPRCAAEQVSVLTRLEDVTGDVMKALGQKTGAESNQVRKQTLTRLEQACEDGYRANKDPHACEAVTLYGGGQYFLYHYKRYDDVRLVFAPELDVAFFGGDVDNFMFPRWNLDFSMLRAYENGRPAKTPDYLRWRRSGPAAGEPVFVAGHPGATARLKTVDQLRFEREVLLPRWLIRAAELRGRYLQFAEGGAEAARIVHVPLFELENSLKVRRNQLATLLDEDLIAARVRAESELRGTVARNPALAADVGAWDETAAALQVFRGFFDRYTMLERGAGFRGELMYYARVLVRAAAERAKPNEARLREYTEAALPQVRQRLLAAQPVYPDLERLELTFSLGKLVEFLGPDDPVVAKVLGHDSPQSLAASLVKGSRLADPAYRKTLWEGGQDALSKSDDPMIRLALGLEPEARALRQRYDDSVEAVIQRAGERIAAARFAVQGTSTYPDATFTLRLTYGTVRGWREGDHDVAPFTDLGGLYRRATGADPFRLPERWLAVKNRLPLATPFNYSSNTDIVGGNSGSPVLDGQGRVVGLIFDGNIHSIGGDYWFDPARNRSVAVHPAAILLALEKVYGATAIRRELSVDR